MDRFSEDIDLDALSKRNIQKIIKDFCKQYNFTYRVSKDTDTTKRFFIDYSDNKSLKIEISYRRKSIEEKYYYNNNGIIVYNINQLCLMKSNAYVNRDKIRDLYDLCFIFNNYFDNLSDDIKNVVRTAVEFKGIEQFEYIVKDQKDELIDTKVLEDNFIKMYQKLELENSEENEDELEM